MRVMLATICLNEMEWLPKLVEQHRDWPGLVNWTFVEGCDPEYARANPDFVDRFGLSKDGATDFLLSNCCGTANKMYHVPQGNSTGGDVYPADQYKCLLRNQYLNHVEHFKPDFIVQLDADEFYTKEDQQRINDLAMFYFYPGSPITSIMLRQRHIWRPPSICPRCEGTGSILSPIPQCEPSRSYHHDCPDCDGSDIGYTPLFSQEVIGGYWQVPHTRIWKYIPGMRHVRNHNWPEVDGRYLTSGMARIDLDPPHVPRPQCVHLGYASSSRNRKAKADYYLARGEGSEGGRVGRKRSMYVDCRDAHLNWKPGDVLPHGARVLPYDGPVPEVFR